MGELSERQASILKFISRHCRDNGYPPTVREIGIAVGLASPSTVHAHLAKLEAAGYIKRDPTKPRAMFVRERRRARTCARGRPRVGAAAGRGRRRRWAPAGREDLTRTGCRAPSRATSCCG